MTDIYLTVTRQFCRMLMKLEFSWKLCEKYPNVKFRENTSSGSRVIPYGQADR